jgi:hypothetical protein
MDPEGTGLSGNHRALFLKNGEPGGLLEAKAGIITFKDQIDSGIAIGKAMFCIPAAEKSVSNFL